MELENSDVQLGGTLEGNNIIEYGEWEENITSHSLFTGTVITMKLSIFMKKFGVNTLPKNFPVLHYGVATAKKSFEKFYFHTIDSVAIDDRDELSIKLNEAEYNTYLPEMLEVIMVDCGDGNYLMVSPYQWKSLINAKIIDQDRDITFTGKKFATPDDKFLHEFLWMADIKDMPYDFSQLQRKLEKKNVIKKSIRSRLRIILYPLAWVISVIGAVFAILGYGSYLLGKQFVRLYCFLTGEKFDDQDFYPYI